jgi:hypothetical protein
MALPIGFQTDANGYYIYKDPSAKKDYRINWQPWLNGDTIDSVVWTVEAGLVKENEGHDDTMVFVEVSGGAPGKAYVCTAHIVTALGLENEQSFRVAIKDI